MMRIQTFRFILLKGCSTNYDLIHCDTEGPVKKKLQCRQLTAVKVIQRKERDPPYITQSLIMHTLSSSLR